MLVNLPDLKVLLESPHLITEFCRGNEIEVCRGFLHPALRLFDSLLYLIA